MAAAKTRSKAAKKVPKKAGKNRAGKNRAGRKRDPIGPRVRLVLQAFLVLFLELALIRWAGSEVVHLSYFTNFVLLGSFLGIGIGFLRARAKQDMFRWASVGLAILVAIVELSVTRLPQGGAELLYFGGSPGNTGLPAWVALPAIFLAVAAVMALVGQGLARAFAEFEPLEAYRLDILGSLLGIVLFSLLSFLGAPPLAWGAVVVGLFIVLAFPDIRVPIAGGVVILLILGFLSFQPDTYWSPYYKIHTVPLGNGQIKVMVNGVPHQVVSPISLLKSTQPTYFTPYEGISPPSDVLIIGAGTGMDTAIALQAGAKHVDAVEIDPRLLKIGEALNPDHPYQDPRVTLHATDGRAFLEASDTKYNLILYALPDSLTLVTGQAGLRLESYLFTKEAIAAAKDHLAPGGTFALYGYFPGWWMPDRMAGLMSDVFGHAPCLPGAVPPTVGDTSTSYSPWWLTMIIEGPATCTAPWKPVSAVVAPPTDDRPFPYLNGTHVPSFYWLAIGLILLVSLLAVRAAGGSLKSMKGFLDLFFMGAAFLLLETKSVVQFSLLFGATWFVNALVFAGILSVIFLAVEISRRVRLRRPVMLYPALFAALGVAWLVSPDALLGLPWPARLVVAVALAFTPVFLANLIFSQRFRDVGSSTVAFGTNLLGAMLGGLLEYSALIVGYRALLIVAALLYLLAWAFGSKHLAGSAAKA